jgi:hypothetical protein
MVRPPLRRLQRSRRLTLSLPQPALQQSAARKCCPGGRERPRRQAPARSVLDDTSTALRSMSEDNARHVECLTAGRKSTLSGMRSLVEGQKVSYEVQADRRTGKEGATNLKAA